MNDLINDINYRDFPAVSNSDLGWLEEYWLPPSVVLDLRSAYANGTLLDNMITEPEKVNIYKRQVQGVDYEYSEEEIAASKEMRKAFYRDPFCAEFVKTCKFQHISYKPSFKINYAGFNFAVPGKCKWDLFRTDIDLSGDIKTTTATTQKQAEEAVRYFEYDRSRAWYMDLEGRSNDILIFISKKNFKVFKIPIRRDSELFKQGKKKYQELAFKWWYLFSDLKTC